MLPPSMLWLNAEFMKKVLRISENDETIEVMNLTMKFSNPNGEHFFSDIIRADVEYSCNKSNSCIKDKKSLIIKVLPVLEDARRKMVSDSGAFDTEIKMMTTTLEKMNELLNEEGYRLNARALYTDTGDHTLLMIEDLGSLGYRMTDRSAGLDLDHCILAMKGLAKFHASSVALYEKDPKITEYRHGVFYTKVPEQVEKFFLNGLRVFAKEILEWTELGSNRWSFSEKMLKLSEYYFKKGFEIFKPKSDEFNVLNHGDCWSTNMLFRYDNEDKVTDHIFVDFQMCCWTTPLMDILMFMNSSTTENVELYHQDILLVKYLEKLTETMSKIGCKTKPPKISFFKNIPPEYEILSIMTACVGLPLLFHGTNTTKSIDQIYQQTDEIPTDSHKLPEYRRRMLRRLQAWHANGVFDL